MKNTIETALDTLLKNSGEGWFCIIEDPKTEKFVQFAYDEEEGLWFDLPKPALTKKELEVALDLLSGYDIKLMAPGIEDEDCEHGNEDCECHEEVFETFNKHLGRDKQLAAEIAYAVMRQVYNLKDDTKLDVTLTR
jgi:hypothetical protein